MGMVSRTVLATLVRLAGPSGLLLAALLSAAPAQADFASVCSGCHSMSGGRVNAADAPGVITQANANHGMGVGGFSAQFPAIAAEIGASFSPTQSVSVNYKSAGNGITINNLVNDAPGAVITPPDW